MIAARRKAIAILFPNAGKNRALARNWQSRPAMPNDETVTAVNPGLEPGPSRLPAHLAPYRIAVEKHGAAFESLLYHSRDTQVRRFEALSKVTPLAGRTIVDFGCGHADLLGWLDEHDVSYRAYLALDAMPAFVAEARSRIERAHHAAAHAEVVDFTSCDFPRFAREPGTTFVFCGSLNMLSQKEASRVLAKAWQALGATSGNALVFNFLSRSPRYVGSKDPLLHRFDAAEMVAFALALTPLTVFCQHYLSGHDATISLLVP